MSEKNAEQRLRDRKQPEYSQAKGHNKRVRDLYPEAWAESTITDRVLADWIKVNKVEPCPYCQAKVKEVDHRVPLSRGGAHALDNLQMLCLQCNRSKGDKLEEEFRQYLVDNPRPPEYRPDEAVLRPEVVDSSGVSRRRYRTRSLFTDYSSEGLWSLEEFKQKYLSIADPTEYRVALQLLGSWKHWKKLSRQRFLSGLLREVRAELKVALRSAAVQRLLSTENVAAVKLIATEDIDFLTPAPKQGVGRPRKQEDALDETDDIQSDLLRIGLN